MTGGGFSTLGIILTSIFTLLFIALIAELIYLYIIRQRRHRRLTSSTSTNPPLASQQQQQQPTCSNLKSSFLRLFCSTQSRVEPSSSAPVTSSEDTSAEDVEIAELLKLQNSRLLFTIREEEREGIDSSATERSSSIGERRRDGSRSVHERRSKSTSLDFAVGGGGGGGSGTSLSVVESSPEVCLVVVVEGDESHTSGEQTTTYQSLQNSSSSSSCSDTSTPYCTPPCQSPVRYFTPTESPTREAIDAGGGSSSDGSGWWST